MSPRVLGREAEDHTRERKRREKTKESFSSNHLQIDRPIVNTFSSLLFLPRDPSVWLPGPPSVPSPEDPSPSQSSLDGCDTRGWRPEAVLRQWGMDRMALHLSQLRGAVRSSVSHHSPSLWKACTAGPGLAPAWSHRLGHRLTSPKLVEDDFTFVTITHLIGFQLNQRGSGGLCLFILLLPTLRITESAGRVTNGPHPIWNSSPPVRDGQGCPGAGPTCRLPSSSQACISNQRLDSFKDPREYRGPGKSQSLLMGFTPPGN